MERQKIRDQIGTLEEQLELLDVVSLANETFSISETGSYDFREESMVRQSIDSLQQLKDLVQEQNLRKSIAAKDFLKRVTGVLVREAHEAGYELAISTHGSGRISLEMVEVSMGAIVACLRASLKSFKGMGKALRVKHRLFTTFSVYLEVKASPTEIYFRLLDDAQGYSGTFRTEFETENHFRKIRSHIANFGGWFRRKSLAEYGGVIEFKASLPLSRFECVRVRGGTSEFLLPASCVMEQGVAPPNARVARPEESAGLVVDAGGSAAAAAVKVAVADFQFWIQCDSIGEAVKARRESAVGFVEEGSWFKNFGVYQEAGQARLLPLMEGEALMNFHLAAWGSNESV